MPDMRLAASTYLNSAPLVHAFSSGKQREKVHFLGDAAPSKCASMLASGLCDIALIPVIEYQRIPGLRVIPGVAVASRNRVASVILITKCPPSEARRIALDSSSRTSQVLLKILFRKKYRNQPEFIERTPEPGCGNLLEDTDGALVIGDPTFGIKARAAELGLHVFDLAEEWRALTGHSFVFAVWAVREDKLEEFQNADLDFVAARDEGVGLIPAIAAEYSEQLHTPASALETYLSENVNYELDPEKLEGMKEYFKLAYECGQIEKVRELSFVGGKV